MLKPYSPLLFSLLFLLSTWLPLRAQADDFLTHQQIEEDLNYLDTFLEKYSAYRDLNGFDYRSTFQSYQARLIDEHIPKTAFGLMVTGVIGQLGDLHARVRGYDLPNSKFLPFTAAPLYDQILALEYDQDQKMYRSRFGDFLFVKEINGWLATVFVRATVPRAAKAPAPALHTRAVKQLKYMEENYAILQESLPDSFTFLLTDGTRDTLVQVAPEENRRAFYTWDEKIVIQYGQEKEELNDQELCAQLCSIDQQGIAYLRLPDMAHPEAAPLYFAQIERFLTQIVKDSSQALIIDIRGNDGGTRHLIPTLARYLVHPDSVYVVNVVKQITDLPGDDDWQDDLAGRFLQSKQQLDEREGQAVDDFMASFKPMHRLEDERFSDYHYMILNGQKLSASGQYFDRPVYILANERCFSAASILVAVFKGLPNITIVGQCTDGSSGNSARFELPNSGIRGKISTMVSFQKDGRMLDGYGTEPDWLIERNLEQVLWLRDYQLETLKQRILGSDN